MTQKDKYKISTNIGTCCYVSSVTAGIKQARSLMKDMVSNRITLTKNFGDFSQLQSWELKIQRNTCVWRITDSPAQRKAVADWAARRNQP